MESPMTELLLSGLKLMLIGMGIVFLFLALLVWIINVTARLVNTFQPVQEETSAAKGGVETDEAELVAVISAAVRRSR